MNKRHVQLSQGVSLVEILLYVALSITVILVVSVLLAMLLQSRIKNQAITEVEQQGLQVMNVITRTLRNADTVGTPSIGVSASSLSVTVPTPAKSPTAFDLVGGAIRITEGVGTPLAITSSRVVASSLQFENLSRPSTPGVIRVTFTLTHVNPEGRNEYDFSKTFVTSTSLRP